MTHLTRIAAALGLTFTPALAAGQTPRATLPFITLDAQIGAASHPERSAATFYWPGGLQVARVAVAVRLGTRGAIRPVAVLDYFGEWGMGDEVSVCAAAPNGSCLQYFPDVSGTAVGLGVRARFGSLLTVGLTGGVGAYKMRDTGGVGTLTGYHADGEIALQFMKHAGAVVNVRHIETEEFRGSRMWYRSITAGLRIQ